MLIYVYTYAYTVFLGGGLGLQLPKSWVLGPIYPIVTWLHGPVAYCLGNWEPMEKERERYMCVHIYIDRSIDR